MYKKQHMATESSTLNYVPKHFSMPQNSEILTRIWLVFFTLNHCESEPSASRRRQVACQSQRCEIDRTGSNYGPRTGSASPRVDLTDWLNLDRSPFGWSVRVCSRSSTCSGILFRYSGVQMLLWQDIPRSQDGHTVLRPNRIFRKALVKRHSNMRFPLFVRLSTSRWGILSVRRCSKL